MGEESWKWKVNPKNIATAFKNTVTGETRFLNPDEYIYAASVYKLPLNMYYADRIAAGEMSMDTPIGGVRYELLMNSSIVSSNNSTAQKLRDAVTWDFGEYQDIVLEYLFPDEKDRVKVDPIFYRSHYYNQHMVINFLSILYENSGKYGYIIDKMKISMPRDSLFKGIDTGYEVAHKYGLFTIDGYQALNDVGIVYMPEPILISMFTKNTSAVPIAKYLVLMVDWSKYCSGMGRRRERHGCGNYRCRFISLGVSNLKKKKKRYKRIYPEKNIDLAGPEAEEKPEGAEGVEAKETLPKLSFGTIVKRALIVFLTTVVALLLFLTATVYILSKGPSNTATGIFVRSVRETSAIGFLANVFLSDEEVETIMKPTMRR